jgi:phosphoribosylformimino-5-aminoimidazole carboxamide ribotide isomerase
MELIPAIDLRGGRCVRLLRGRFDAETSYSAAPPQLLERYRSLGAATVHVVDLDGARDGVPANRELIAQLAGAGTVRLQVGGGVRSQDTIAELLTLGVARIVLGSLAVTRPREVRTWLTQFGPERIVLALDVRHDQGRPMLASHGWERETGRSLWEILDDTVDGYGASALRHVLCTDVECDGTLAGPNVGLYEAAVRRFPGIAWQASGGVRDVADLRALHAAGVSAVVSGRALLEERLPAEELGPFLQNA